MLNWARDHVAQVADLRRLYWVIGYWVIGYWVTGLLGYWVIGLLDLEIYRIINLLNASPVAPRLMAVFAICRVG